MKRCVLILFFVMIPALASAEVSIGYEFSSLNLDREVRAWDRLSMSHYESDIQLDGLSLAYSRKGWFAEGVLLTSKSDYLLARPMYSTSVFYESLSYWKFKCGYLSEYGIGMFLDYNSVTFEGIERHSPVVDFIYTAGGVVYEKETSGWGLGLRMQYPSNPVFIFIQCDASLLGDVNTDVHRGYIYDQTLKNGVGYAVDLNYNQSIGSINLILGYRIQSLAFKNSGADTRLMGPYFRLGISF